MGVTACVPAAPVEGWDKAAESIPQRRQSWVAEGSILMSPQHVMLGIRANIAKGKSLLRICRDP